MGVIALGSLLVNTSNEPWEVCFETCNGDDDDGDDAADDAADDFEEIANNFVLMIVANRVMSVSNNVMVCNSPSNNRPIHSLSC